MNSYQNESTVEVIRTALHRKYVVWDSTDWTLLDGKGGSSSMPCEQLHARHPVPASLTKNLTRGLRFIIY